MTDLYGWSDGELLRQLFAIAALLDRRSEPEARETGLPRAESRGLVELLTRAMPFESVQAQELARPEQWEVSPVPMGKAQYLASLRAYLEQLR